MPWRKNKLALYDILQKNHFMSVVIIAIMLIPLLYSFLYLSAFFDPYEHTKNLPVAVVNEDQGVEVDGETIRAGDELVKQLEKNDSMKWVFLDNYKEMDLGFQQDRYYMGIVIPKNFSETAASIQDPKPVQGIIRYYANEGSNYLSSQIGNKVVQELEKNVQKSLARTYAEGIFDKMEESVKSLDKASEGASKLADATEDAAEGAKKLKNGTQLLKDKVDKLNGSTAPLTNGMDQLVDGLKKSRDGSQKLTEGAGRLESGLGEMKEKVGESSKDLPKLKNGAQEIQNGIGEIRKFVNQPGLQSAAGTISEEAGQIKEKHQEAQKMLDTVLEEYPELESDPAVTRLKEKMDQVSRDYGGIVDRAAKLDTKLKQAQSDVDQMYQGQGKVVEGIGKVESGFNQQHTALTQLHKGAGTLSGSLQEMYQGQRKLLSGSTQLQNGIHQAADAPNQMSEALGKLNDGSDELNKGLFQIENGQSTLADKLAGGADDARSQLEGKDEKAEQMADPVAVDKESINKVPNYATGFTPYFISLSLWVGAMILFTVIDMKRMKWGEERQLSILTAVLIGVIQALLLTVALRYGLGIEPKNEWWFFLFPLATSFAFIAINHLLVAVMKDVGRFVAILILMLQLSASAGTYPAELLPDFFQSIHPYLPMTYSVEGLRAAISTGNETILWNNLLILFSIAIGSYLLLAVFNKTVAVLKNKKQTKVAQKAV